MTWQQIGNQHKTLKVNIMFCFLLVCVYVLIGSGLKPIANSYITAFVEHATVVSKKVTQNFKLLMLKKLLILNIVTKYMYLNVPQTCLQVLRQQLKEVIFHVSEIILRCSCLVPSGDAHFKIMHLMIRYQCVHQQAEYFHILARLG